MVPPTSAADNGGSGPAHSGPALDTSPLLQPAMDSKAKRARGEDAGGAGGDGGGEGPGGGVMAEAPVSLWAELGAEARALFHFSWPVSAATVFRMALPTTDTAFVGRLGTDQLAGASLSVTLSNVVAQIPFGAAVSLNTLCSQAHGANNFALVGTWLRVALVMVTLLCLPAILCLIFVEPVLKPVVDDPNVRHYAGVYGRWISIGLWPTLVYCAVRQYFQAQGIVWPATVVSAISVVTNFLLNMVLIHGVGDWGGLGFVGSPTATNASVIWMNILFVAVSCWWKGYHKATWHGWSFDWADRTRLWHFLKMAVPTSVAQIAEESGFQILVIMGGHLGSTDTAANGILAMVWAVAWGLWWGVGLGTQVRVGNFLGANSPQEARRAALVGFLVTVALCVLVGVAIVLFGSEIAMVFSNDPKVHQQVQANSFWLALAFFSSSISMCLSAIIYGGGETGQLSVVTFVCCWAIMLPASYLLAFWTGLGLAGLWIGPVIGEAFKVIGLGAILSRFDWERLAKQAVARAEADSALEGNSNDDGDPGEGKRSKLALGGAGHGSIQADPELGMSSADETDPLLPRSADRAHAFS